MTEANNNMSYCLIIFIIIVKYPWKTQLSWVKKTIFIISVRKKDSISLKFAIFFFTLTIRNFRF